MVQTAILALEVLLLSTGLVSTFFMLKSAIGPACSLFDMVLVNLMEILNLLKNFLSSPLYIFLFINSVVVLILTFSKFNHPRLNFLNVLLDEKDDVQVIESANKPPQRPAKEDMPAKRTNSAIAVDTLMSFFNHYSQDVHDEMPIMKDIIEIDYVQTASFRDMPHDLTEASEIKKPRSPNSPQIISQNTTNTFTNELNQENIEEEDDSLEATWEAITGGNKKKQVLKKCETWPRAPVPAQSIESKDLLPSVAAAWKDMRKSVTFNDSLAMFRRGGLRGDLSVSTEESNKKFDDFIRKINHERILQRKESADQRALKNNFINRAR